MNNRRKLYEQIIRELILTRPIGNVGTEYELCALISLAEAVINPLFVCRAIIFVLGGGVIVINVGRRGDISAVCGGCGDASRIHKSNARELSLTGL